MLWIIIIYIFIYLFLFKESRILRFTIQIYDSIYEILPTIQSRIPILTTMAIAALLHRILTKEKWQKWKNCSTNKMSSTKVPIDAKQLPSIFNKDKRSWKVSSISKCRSPTSKANWTAVKAKCPPSLNHFFHLLSVSASSPPKPLSSSPCLSLTHWLSLISFSSSFYFSS